MTETAQLFRRGRILLFTRRSLERDSELNEYLVLTWVVTSFCICSLRSKRQIELRQKENWEGTLARNIKRYFGDECEESGEMVSRTETQSECL